MNLPLWTLAAVLVLIAFRRLGPLRLHIWQIVLAGALVVVLMGSIAWDAALRAIDWEVIGFLFGVFVVGHALVESGLLARASTRLLGGVRSADGLVLAVLFAGGLSSALLMNDTLAVIGTPLMLRLARDHRLPASLLLLALAAGSTMFHATRSHGWLWERQGTAVARCGPARRVMPRRRPPENHRARSSPGRHR